MTELEQADRQRVLDLMAQENSIFVFGSNELGVHGSGAAKDALDLYEAEFGIGEGPTGRCYAIPTKSSPYETREIHKVRDSVRAFLLYAREHPELTFALTRVGCGLAGIKEARMEMFFSGAPMNVNLPIGWRRNLILMRKADIDFEAEQD